MAHDLSQPSHAGGTPLVHRPSAPTCQTTRAAASCGGLPGLCTSDASCTMGTNGRCYAVGNAGCQCSYDQCFADSDCTSGQTCNCRADGSTAPNSCVASNCRSDADCGPGGYCSPTLDPTCGARIGIVGYYCHTANDGCTNDSDCPADAAVGATWCAYHSEVGSWQCSVGFCVG
jgi:hypothetical protein